jgi:hypothetical protein
MTGRKSSSRPANNPSPASSRAGARLLSLSLLLLAAAIAPLAQAAQIQPPRVKVPGAADTRDQTVRGEQEDLGQSSSTEEMIKRVEIKRREEQYKENLERAKESAQLGAEIREAFERNKTFSEAELKKLGRLEKLARTIRNDAGGDDDEEASQDLPAQLPSAVSRLAELSEDLQKKVEKTPKHVVSTAVINSANKLLVLIKYIKKFGR